MPSALFILLVAASVLAVLLTVVVLGPAQAYWGWKLRHIPGPRSHPVLGHLLDIIRHGSAPVFLKLSSTIGPVFKVWVGRQPIVVLTDPELIRSAGNKVINRSPLFHILRGTQKELVEADLLFARDEMWRTLRKAWQPVFSSSSLAGYMALMDQSATCLANLLLSKCDNEGGVGERVDIHWQLGRMTLQAVGTCAYGVNFNALDGASDESDAGYSADTQLTGKGGPDASSSPAGLILTRACKTIFETASLQRGSLWNRINLLLPLLRPLTSLLAHTFPDKPFRRQLQARQHIIDVVRALIAATSTTATPSPSTARATVTATATAATTHSPGFTGSASQGAASPAKPAPDSASRHGVGGVAPGSFLGLLLAARNKQTGEALTDNQIMAQTQTFILAGYETTANALAFTIYLVSTHPHVQERLLQEVDRLMQSVGGPDAALTLEHLDQCEYMGAVFSEALRLYPPAHVTSRQSKEDLTLGGHRLPAGSRLFLSIYSAHHNPQLWPDPDAFRPERFLTGEVPPHAHIPFGVGARMCIGHKFAIAEAKVTLIRLFSRLSFDLEPGQVPLPITYGITMTPRHGIWVRPRARSTTTAGPGRQ